MNAWSAIDTTALEVLARQLTAAAANAAQLAVAVGGTAAFHAGSLGSDCVLVAGDSWQGPAASAAASAAGRVGQGLTALTWALGETAVALTQLASALAQAQTEAAAAERSWAGESAAAAAHQARVQAMAAQAAELADMRCASTLAEITSAASPLARVGIIRAPATDPVVARHIVRRPPAVEQHAGRGVGATRARSTSPRVLAGSLHSAHVLVVLPLERAAGESHQSAGDRGGWRVAHVAGRAGRPTAVLRAATAAPLTRPAGSPSAPVATGTSRPAPSAEADGYLACILAEVASALSGLGAGALLAGVVALGGAVVAVTGGGAEAISAEIAWADRALTGLLSTAGCWQRVG